MQGHSPVSSNQGDKLRTVEAFCISAKRGTSRELEEPQVVLQSLEAQLLLQMPEQVSLQSANTKREQSLLQNKAASLRNLNIMHWECTINHLHQWIRWPQQKTNPKLRKHLFFPSPGLGHYSSSKKGQTNIIKSGYTGGTGECREEKTITSPFQQQWPADQLSCLRNHSPRPLWPTLLLALDTRSLKPLDKIILLHHLRANKNKKISCMLSEIIMQYIQKDFQLIELFIYKFLLNH